MGTAGRNQCHGARLQLIDTAAILQNTSSADRTEKQAVVIPRFPFYVIAVIAKMPACGPVSYTHLDVYKRQGWSHAAKSCPCTRNSASAPGTFRKARSAGTPACAGAKRTASPSFGNPDNGRRNLQNTSWNSVATGFLPFLRCTHRLRNTAAWKAFWTSIPCLKNRSNRCTGRSGSW